ncbi:uncharacterized protein LOC141830692 [Curcuma longa]|uniref:uncharacterized protein LOC141830692 n=1 Tax=Curcuma longa TaxID=136217 RepID=UPI003D9F1A45
MMSSGGYASIGDDNNGTNVSGTVPAVVAGADHVALKFKESNLQTFPPSSESQGKIPVFRPPSCLQPLSRLIFAHTLCHLGRGGS